jgi:hypothetical protein
MERRHQKIAGAADAVAGEDAAGTVGAVRCGREADEKHPRAQISKTWDRPAPVHIIYICAPFFARDPGAVRAEPRTAIAGHDGGVNVA